MSWNHLNGIMFDLETVSSRPNSSILSLAAVRFDVDTGIIDREFMVNFKVSEGVKLGLHKQQRTLDWWSQPERKDVLKLLLQKQLPYSEALTEFSDYILAIKPNMIWSWGTHFDLPVLESSLVAAFGEDVVIPWKYNKVCDARTLLNCFQVPITRGENAHDPLIDVKDQAKYVIEFFKDIGN